MRFASLATCEIFPLASLIATTLDAFLAILIAVSGKILQPVRLGTLYKIIGTFTLFATDVKCSTRPF